MATRSVKVVLEAQVAGFAASMKRAQAAVKDLSTGSATAHQQMAKSARAAADASRAAYDQAAKAARTAAAAEKAAAKGADDAAKQRLRAATVNAKAAAATAKEDWQAKAATAKDAEQAARSAAASAGEVKAAWDKTSTSLMVGGAAIVAGIGGIVKTTAGFEKSMSGVAAVANASGSEMEALSAKAKQLGADTSFSASQAAVAEAELAKAGVSVADILSGALKGSMDLAAAGQLDLAEASTISAQAMNLFGLKGSQVSHIADILASGANKSAADVHDLGMGLSQTGTMAAQMGLSLEDTVATLSLFADNGMKGSDAGTSFKTMLARLTPQSEEQSKAMAAVNLAFYDANGKFVGMEESARRLSAAMSGLSEEQRNSYMNTIFGSDASRAAAILLRSQSDAAKSAGKSWMDYRKAMDDVGAANRMAATQLDNLAGDWEKLMGSLETAALNGGGGLTAGLRSVVQQATEAVDILGQVPAPIAEIGVQAGLSVGGFMLMAGGMMKGISAAQEAHEAFTTLQGKTPKTAAAVKALGVTFAALAAVQFASAIIDQVTEVNISVEEMTNRIVTQQASLEDALGGFHTIGLFGLGQTDINNIESINDALSHLGDNSGLAKFTKGVDAGIASVAKWARRDYQVVADGLGKIGESLATVASSDLPQAQAAFKRFYDQVDEANRPALLDAMPAYKQHLVDVANALGIAADQSNLLGLATGRLNPEMIAAGNATRTWGDEMRDAGLSSEGVQQLLGLTGMAATGATVPVKGAGEAIKWMGGEADEAAPKLSDVTKEIKGLAAASRGLWGAENSYEEALDAATKSIAEHGSTLDRTTDAGRANRSALSGLAQATLDLMASQAEADKPASALAATWEQGRAALLRTLGAMGIYGPRAQALATELLGTKAAAVDSVSKINELGGAIDGLNGKGATVNVDASTATTAKTQIDLFGDAIRNAPTSLQPIVGAPGAPAATSQILSVTAAANGVPSSIAAVTSAPGAVGATDDLWGTAAAARVVDAQAPTVTAGTNAPVITGMLYGAAGAAVVLDGKAPFVTASTNASSVTSQLWGTNAAANAIDGKVVDIAIRLSGVSSAAGVLASWGGLHTGGHFTAHAAGGDHWRDSKGRTYPRTKPLLMGKATGVTDVVGSAFGAGESWLDWETYISSDPRYRRQNMQYAADAVGRLGGSVTWHESGAQYAPAPMQAAPASPYAGLSRADMAAMLDAHADRITRAVREGLKVSRPLAGEIVRAGQAQIRSGR